MTRLLILCAALFLCACDRPPEPAAAPSTAFAPAATTPTGLRILTHPTLGEIWLLHPITADAAGGAPPTFPQAALDGIARRFGDALTARFVALPRDLRRDAPFAGDPAPLVILTPGANMSGVTLLGLAQRLVTEGYVVAVLHPEGSPGPSDARYGQAADEIAAAIAFLTAPDAAWSGWIRPGPIGLVGHSLGGAASVSALRNAPAGSAAVNLDGDYSGEAVARAAGPTLYLIGTTEGEAERSRDRRRRTWAGVSGGAPDAVALQFAGMNHFDATDLSRVADAAPPERRRNRFGPSAPGATLDRLNALTVAWLDRWLKGDDGAWTAARQADPGAVDATTF